MLLSRVALQGTPSVHHRLSALPPRKCHVLDKVFRQQSHASDIIAAKHGITQEV